MNAETKKVQRAVRKGRRFLQEGIVGSDLKERLASLYPHFSLPQRRAVMAALKPQQDVLGHAVLDPNLSRSCVAAKQELRRHPHRDTIVAVLKTPMCAGCRDRRDSSCGFIGAGPLPIVASLNGLSEHAAEQTATTLVTARQVSSKHAERIMNESGSPSQRIARLHRASRDTSEPFRRHVLDVQRSTQFAGMFDGSGQAIDIQPIRTSSRRRRIANPERGEAIHVTRMPGDRQVERRNARVAAAMEPASITIQPMRVQKPQTVTVAYQQKLRVPRKDRTTRRLSSIQAMQGDQARDSFDRLIKTASRALSRGEVDGSRAGSLLERFEAHRLSGIRPNRRAAAIIEQIQRLAGHLV